MPRHSLSVRLLRLAPLFAALLCAPVFASTEAAPAATAKPVAKPAAKKEPAPASAKPVPKPATAKPEAPAAAKPAQKNAPPASPVTPAQNPAPAPKSAKKPAPAPLQRSEDNVRISAARADLFVRAGSGDAPIRWNQLVYKDGQLVFGAPNSLGSIIWETALDLGDYAMRSLFLVGGADARDLATLVMQREIIGHRGLALRGNGRLDLHTANEHFTGPLQVDGTELRLAERGTLKRHPAVAVTHGGRFVIDNSDDAHIMNKRFNGGDLALSGATFRYLTRDNAAALERIGTLRVNTGASKFEISGGGTGPLGTTITIAQLRFGSPAAHLDFVSSHAADYSANTRITFQHAPKLLHNVLPQSTVNGRDWATVDSQGRLRAYAAYETGSEKTWGKAVNAAPAQNQILSADRSLASLKFSGGEGFGKDEDGNPLGRVVDLADHTLRITGAGILATSAPGEDMRHQIIGGKLTTTRPNFEFHVTGEGGLALVNTVLSGEGAPPAVVWKTGLVKTGDGELLLISPPIPKAPGKPVPVKDNTFAGDVYVNQGTLTLFRKKSPTLNIPGLNVYVGAGIGDAVLNVKSASEQINKNATVTLRGSESGEAVLRLERLQAGRGPRQTLKTLKIEGSGVIEFRDSHIGNSPIDDNTKSILYLSELDIQGELVVRGWDKYNTHILLDSKTAPTEELLSKIHFEGEANGDVLVEKFRFNNRDYWEIKAEFIFPPDPVYPTEPTVPGTPEAPEPSSYGLLISAAALAFALWQRWRLRTAAAKPAALPTQD